MLLRSRPNWYKMVEEKGRGIPRGSCAAWNPGYVKVLSSRRGVRRGEDKKSAGCGGVDVEANVVQMGESQKEGVVRASPARMREIYWSRDFW